MVKEFSNAIVKTPCKNIINGLTGANLGKPDYQKAVTQHSQYINALKECGLNITLLPKDNNYPDSVFVEDIALCTPDMAIITNPGADSRKGERENIEKTLKIFYKNIEYISNQGSVDAGDIMMVNNHYYIGISDRTDHNGAEQVISILEKYNMTGSKIEVDDILHLKTGISYLEKNNLLISERFRNIREFESFNRIFVNLNEEYASNSLWINDIVLTPAGFPETSNKLESAGYKIIKLEMSEFQKVDGGLSCLSLRF